MMATERSFQPMAVDDAMDSLSFDQDELFLFSENMDTFDFAIDDQPLLFTDPETFRLFNHDQAQASDHDDMPDASHGELDVLEPPDTLDLPEQQIGRASGLDGDTTHVPTVESNTTVPEGGTSSSDEVLADPEKEPQDPIGTVSGARCRIKALEWTKKRALIKRLYMDEDKSLAITRRILKEEHGFDAS